MFIRSISGKRRVLQVAGEDGTPAPATIEIDQETEPHEIDAILRSVAALLEPVR